MSDTPYIISAVTNLVTSTNWPSPANTPYSFAVTRVPIDPDGPDGPVDLVVDGYGHTGVGILDPLASRSGIVPIVSKSETSFYNPLFQSCTRAGRMPIAKHE